MVARQAHNLEVGAFKSTLRNQLITTVSRNRYCFCYNKLVKTNIKYFEFKTFDEMYSWLLDNHKKVTELYVKISRQKPEKCKDIISYYDAVEAALCFGWIDSTLRNIDGMLIQRFSPRQKKSHWTENNINKCLELDKKGLMTAEGIKICPIFSK